MKVLFSACAALALAAACARTPAAIPDAPPPAPSLAPARAASPSPSESSAIVTVDAVAPEPGGWMTVPGKGVAPEYVERSTVIAAIRASKHRALLRHETHVEDCSSIGGSHLYFVVLSRASEMAYYGGRGVHLPGLEIGAYFLAAIEPLPKPRSTKDAYACVPDRKVHVRVTALLPVASEAEGTRLLEELGSP